MVRGPRSHHGRPLIALQLSVLLVRPAGPVHSQQTPPVLATLDTSVVLETGDTVVGERGFLPVKENRLNRASRTIHIRFLRFRSMVTNPGAPLFFLAGGPGASGVASAGQPFFQDLREVGDVVLVDQRGTPGSEPSLICPERWTVPTDRAGTWDDHLTSLRRFAASCARYWEAQGVDLTGYNTSESADDVAELATALGADRIVLYGVSYGTHLGLDIMRRHPRLVERAVLSGVLALDDLYPPSLPSAIQQQLVRVDSALRADPVAAAKIPDLLGLMREVLAALEARPATVVVRSRSGDSVSMTFGAFDVQRSIAEGLNNRNNFARWLPNAFLAASRGDWSLLVPSRSMRLSAMKLAVTCATGVSAGLRGRIETEGPTTVLGVGASFPGMDYCDSVPHRNLGEAFRSYTRSTVPVLFVNGTFDRDRVEKTESIRRWFPNSQHLIIVGGFHDDSPPKAHRQVLRFLRGQPVEQTQIRLPLYFPDVDRW
jgi:pimeloyl-ACP methyl ester carboxylesterase